MYNTVMYNTVMYCTVMDNTEMYCTVMDNTVMYWDGRLGRILILRRKDRKSVV